MREEKNGGKRVSKSGVGAERADREKGVKIAKMGKRCIQIAMIRVLAMRPYVERVGKTTCTLIWTSNQRQKTSVK